MYFKAEEIQAKFCEHCVGNSALSDVHLVFYDVTLVGNTNDFI